MVMRKIKLNRGKLANLPQLELGEPAVATDDGSLHIGTEQGNVKLAKDADVQAVSQQLADKSALMEELKKSTEKIPHQQSMFEKLTGKRKKVEFPDGWTWVDAPISIEKDGSGFISTDFDASELKPDVSDKKTYYVSLGGSSSNTGLTPDSPVDRFMRIVSNPDVGRVVFTGGVYPRNAGVSGYKLENDIILEAAPGEEVILSAHDDLDWTKTEGYTNVYQATRSSVADVWDSKFVDSEGNYKEMSKKTSIAEVDAESASWFSSGSTLYVHTANSRPADISIRAYLLTDNLYVLGGGTYYCEGISFEGGRNAALVENTSTGLNPTFIAKNCKFKYANQSNCLSTRGATSYLQNCTATKSLQDGFNYHHNNGVIAKAIEVDCRGFSNGRNGENQNNGSTMHDGGYVIRVNGEYYNNMGPNVIDVNTGGESWNIGTTAHHSLANNGTVSNSDFKNGNVGSSKMWLDSCISFGSDYSIVTAGDGSSTFINNNLNIPPMATDPGNELLEYETNYATEKDFIETESPSFLKHRKNYDSNTGEGWVIGNSRIHTATAPGDSLTVTFNGTGIDMITDFTEDGGVWEIEIDGEPIMSFSNHENEVRDAVFLSTRTYRKTISRNLEKGDHTLVATFKGDDPKNAPESGVSAGYVYYGDGVTLYSSFDVYDRI